jgi:fumarate reductase flavoprotein subunit
MGGVRTDAAGASPQLKGLFAAGEAACWDLHGFNRLGGNSVAETVVAGMIVGEFIADFCDSPASEITLSTALAREFHDREAGRLAAIAGRGGSENPFALMREMQQAMTAGVGIFRTGAALQEAVSVLRQLHARAADIGLRSQARGANPELVAAYRVPRMLKLALCVAEGALARTESRGAHYRHDYPRRNDRDWLKRTLATWPEGAEGPRLDYEALDVKTMELPPGWRGYGARDHLEHPDTVARAAEVEQARAQGGAPTPSFEHLLPPRFRGSNARLGEEST